jgi:hypothetical protein
MNKPGTRGKVNIGCITLILLLIVGGYVGFKFGRVYLAQYMLDRKVFEITGAAADDWKGVVFPSDTDVANAVMEEAQNLSVDITYDDILIEREEKYVRIKVTWEGDIVIPFYTYHYYFPFDYKRDRVY